MSSSRTAVYPFIENVSHWTVCSNNHSYEESTTNPVSVTAPLIERLNSASCHIRCVSRTALKVQRDIYITHLQGPASDFSTFPVKSGGSGGARTRNLCRDRAAL